MKLYGLVKQVWIMDEGMSIPDADSVELYESQAERDERLLYLNGGHGEDYFDRRTRREIERLVKKGKNPDIMRFIDKEI